MWTREKTSTSDTCIYYVHSKMYYLERNLLTLNSKVIEYNVDHSITNPHTYSNGRRYISVWFTEKIWELKTSVELRFALISCFNVPNLVSCSRQTQTASGSFRSLKRRRRALIETRRLRISRGLCIRALSRGRTALALKNAPANPEARLLLPFPPLRELTVPRCCQNSFG